MSDEETQTEDQSPAPAPPKKRGKLGIVIAILVTAALAAGGAFLAPRYLSLGSVAKAAPAADPDAVVNPTVPFQPIVVDVRATGEEMHHLKVTLTFELADQVKAEDFEKYAPRGREAAILYLRTRTFDDVTRPEKFPEISRELNDKVLEAVGKQRVRRMMITDFVTQ